MENQERKRDYKSAAKKGIGSASRPRTLILTKHIYIPTGANHSQCIHVSFQLGENEELTKQHTNKKNKQQPNPSFQITNGELYESFISHFVSALNHIHLKMLHC